MFSPVGSQPQSVYWRRRLIVLGSVVLLLVLIVLTLRAVTGGDDGSQAAGGSPTGSSAGSTSASPTRAPTTKQTSNARSKSGSKSSKATSSTRPAPQKCKAADLAVRAYVAKKSYAVDERPMVELEVTNTGTAACVQDLADQQVELRVYNGESRVWGSHDCEIQDGTNERTLAPDRAVRVSVTWTGLTSQKGCKGTRQRVGAGTYTLYAALSGKTGKAAQFSIG